MTNPNNANEILSDYLGYYSDEEEDLKMAAQFESIRKRALKNILAEINKLI